MFSYSVLEKVGTVKAFGGSTAPDGWLFCDGAAISRTTYAALFAVIGTTYGAGDGSTTFNLPNLSGVLGVSAPVDVYGNGKALAFEAKDEVNQEVYPFTVQTRAARSYNVESTVKGYLGLGLGVNQPLDGTTTEWVNSIQNTNVGLMRYPPESGVAGTANLNTASQHAAAIIKY